MPGSEDTGRGVSGEGLSRPFARSFALLIAAFVTLLVYSILVIASPPSGSPSGVFSELLVSPAYAQDEPDEPAPDEEDDEEESSTGACERGAGDSFTDSFAQLSGGSESGKKTPASNVWMTCSPDYYYLTYVDTRSLFGKVSDLAEKPAVSVVTGLGKTIFNSFASSVFVWHAKLMALTLAVMNWAFDIDFVATLEEPVERIVGLLGRRVYEPLLGGAWGIALAYAAWKGIARDQVSDSIMVIVKTAVIGTFGLVMIQSPMRVVNWYDDYIDEASNFIFGIAADVAENGSKADGKDDNTNASDPGNRPGEQDGRRFNVLSAAVWRMYVDEPWSRLQISNSDPGYAEKHYMSVLDIKNQDERAEKLCEMAGSNCGDVSGGEEPEDTSPEDTSGEGDEGDEGDDEENGGGGSGPGGQGPADE